MVHTTAQDRQRYRLHYIGPICSPIKQFKRLVGTTINVDCKLEPGERCRVPQFCRPNLIDAKSAPFHRLEHIVARPRINVGETALPRPRPTQNHAETGRPNKVVECRRLMACRHVLEDFQAESPVVDRQPVLRYGQVEETNAPGSRLFDERRAIE